MKGQRLVVLDAHALIHRAYHALPHLTAPDGRPVGALYGLCLTLLNVLKTFRPTHVVAAFDRPEKTFRHEQFAAYKAQRAKAPEDLVAQLIRARDIVTAFGVRIADAKGFEADDVIGTVTTRASRSGIDSIVVTGDQDTLQLVDERTRVHMLRRGVKDTVTMGPAEVKERFGLAPRQLIDFKALRGDPSDNIPGVRGIGEKTATDLLQRFGSLAGMMKHLPELPEALQEKLRDGRAALLESKDLVTIRRNVALDFSLDDLAWKHGDRAPAIALFQELGFASLLSRLPQGEGGQATAGKPAQGSLLADAGGDSRAKRRTPGYRLVTSAEDLAVLRRTLEQSTGFVVDTETDTLGARTAPLHGISIAVAEGGAWYVPAALVVALKDILENPRLPKWGHNLKYDIAVLARCGIRVRPLAFDTMLASYILAPGTRTHGLDSLAFTILGHEMIPIEALIGKRTGPQKILSAVPLDDVVEYSGEDADYTLRLVRHFTRELEAVPTLRRVFTEIEMPLIPVLAHLECVGVKLDVALLATLGKGVGKTLGVLERQIHRAAGVVFNVNSPVQLREILFTKLKLPTAGVGRTQSGFSTAAEELEKLQDAHPMITFLREYRELAKLKNTYLDALPEQVDPATGRVYTSYNQTVAATGRLSSSSPNLQNIPIRTDLGGEIRKAFVAERGHLLVAADYSQLELRIAAHVARDNVMEEAFLKGKDIHTETAAFAFHIPPETVTKEQRRQAKTLNFGVLYGMGPQAFARAAGIPFGEAQAFIDAYMRTYRGIADFMREAKALAAREGYVETIYGRRRYLPEIHSSNSRVRSAAERMAINHPIQGTASDIMKRAMITLFARVEQGTGAFRDVAMILQVHDELVFEAPAAQAEALAREVQQTMESLERLRVLLVVDMRVGKTWGEMHAV